MKTIVIIVLYFGKWPSWLNIFIESCRRNPTIDWIFFSDCGMPEKLSQNIKFVEMQLSDFNKLASDKLGLKVNLKKEFLFKLCDFKPAQGLIFEDYLKHYDFWACADIDLIYGDIRKFITDVILEHYDIITANKAYLVGHFTLYRNSDYMNRLFSQVKGYKRVFSNNHKWYDFDECSKDWNNLVQGGSAFAKRSIKERTMCGVNRLCEFFGSNGPFWVRREIEGMTECVKRLEKKGKLKSFFENIGGGYELVFILAGDSWKVFWQKGRMIETNSGKEIMYFHFLKLKSDKRFFVPEWRKVPEAFFISKKGIFESLE